MNNVASYDLKITCSGCGMCSYICPQHAIEIKLIDGGYYPVIDKHLCNGCGKCVKVCPGLYRDWDNLNKSVFGGIPEDIYIGNYCNIFYGYATNTEIRYSSSSGGMVTGLLVYMLKQKFIDGAIVTKFIFEDNTIRAKAFIATTEKEVLDSRGSKYCPVDFHNALNEIRHFTGKLAVVCLPCHAISLRKAMLIDKNLSSKIEYIFSLFCGRTPLHFALDTFLKEQKVNGHITDLYIRGNGWPGKTVVWTDRNDKMIVAYLKVWRSFLGKDIFLPLSCYCCYDFLGEFADISFGDAWIPQCKNDNTGSSVFIIRTSKADDVIKKAKEDNIITMRPLSTNVLKTSFFTNLFTKKNNARIHELITKHPFPVRDSKKISNINVFSFIYESIRFLEIRNRRYNNLLLNKIKNFSFNRCKKKIKL